MNDITDVDAFTAPITVLEDGEPVAQSKTLPTVQGLSNRTRWLYNLLGGALITARNLVLVATSGNTTALDATGHGTEPGAILRGSVAGSNGANAIASGNGHGMLGRGAGTGIGLVSNNGIKPLESGVGSDVLSGFVSRGTITPSISGSGGAPVVAYGTNRVLLWTRINSIVFFEFHIDFTYTSGGSGYFLITDLPYGIKNRTVFSTSGGLTLGRGWGVGDWPIDEVSAYPSGTDKNMIPRLAYNVIAIAGASGALNNWAGRGWYYTDDAF